jgi:ribosomal protein S18 acetylase RimI-like enzyme
LLTLHLPTLADAQTLSALGRQAFTETFGHLYPPEDLAAHLAKDYDPVALADSLARADEHWRLAVWSGQPAGFVKWGPCHLPLAPLASPQWELHRLYVLEAFQGKGMGRALMDAALTHMEAAGAAEICLGVWENNHKAQAFYATYGFSKAGEYDYPVGRQLDREWILRRQIAAKRLEASA